MLSAMLRRKSMKKGACPQVRTGSLIENLQWCGQADPQTGPITPAILLARKRLDLGRGQNRVIDPDIVERAVECVAPVRIVGAEVQG